MWSESMPEIGSGTANQKSQTGPGTDEAEAVVMASEKKLPSNRSNDLSEEKLLFRAATSTLEILLLASLKFEISLNGAA